MEETEIEEGEASLDSSVDLDIALSYLDEKLQDVLGHFRKDFEGEISAENLGAKYGGYGSFLPSYMRYHPRSHPKTSPEVYNNIQVRLGSFMEETELEEGEATLDSSIDLDIALSYIDEKLQDVLGHFRKDFEGEISAENLGAKYGGYGSFLPSYMRYHPRSHPKTSPEVYNNIQVRLGSFMEETELEEGEATLDSSIDLDIALSYIDEKLQDVLGHFRKDFEGEISAENLGAKYGGYGSFLPSYMRYHPRSHPKTSPEVYNNIQVRLGSFMEETELEEGEATLDSSIDLDIALSYIDEKLQAVLGHFRKDFEGEISAENLGAKYGGFGSFLPRSHPKTSPEVYTNIQFRLRSLILGCRQSWTYAIFWRASLNHPAFILRWGDGYFKGEEANNPRKPPEEQAHRKRVLRELSLIDEPDKKLDDVTDSEWFFLVSMRQSFVNGSGVPGQALYTSTAVWVTGAERLASFGCEHAQMAASLGIQTSVYIPLVDGVVELASSSLIFPKSEFDLLDRISPHFKFRSNIRTLEIGTDSPRRGSICWPINPGCESESSVGNCSMIQQGNSLSQGDKKSRCSGGGSESDDRYIEVFTQILRQGRR